MLTLYLLDLPQRTAAKLRAERRGLGQGACLIMSSMRDRFQGKSPRGCKSLIGMNSSTATLLTCV
jgi:hypothetical protein